MQSLSGHASPVESVTFNSAEVLVLAGASAGVVKLWDLEETKSTSWCSSFCKNRGKKWSCIDFGGTRFLFLLTSRNQEVCTH